MVEYLRLNNLVPPRISSLSKPKNSALKDISMDSRARANSFTGKVPIARSGEQVEIQAPWFDLLGEGRRKPNHHRLTRAQRDISRMRL